jgi:hypothetical protein
MNPKEIVSKYWSNITKTIIAGVIMGVLTLSINFYVDSKVNIAVQIEREQAQERLITENKAIALKVKLDCIALDAKLDSNLSDNAAEHLLLKKSIDNLALQVNRLTYVVQKNNKAMKIDLEELKRLQKPINYVWKPTKEELIYQRNTQ